VKTSNKGASRTPSGKQSADQVSELTTNRLSLYLRCLNVLESAGVRTISSQALAEQFHLNAAQIRKDLAYFGEFGVRGVGYYVRDLKRHLRQILGLDQKLRVAIMGAGNLGRAAASPSTTSTTCGRFRSARAFASPSSPCRRRRHSTSSISSSPPASRPC
jgi:NADH/NAD ratio-sensing transcriptional regulator Rex